GYFLTDSRYKSSINSKFKIDAVFPLDFDLNKLSGFSNIKILNSTIFNDELKSGDLRAKFSPNRIEDVSVKLNSNFLNIDAAGR
ncbi:MAG: hypothetical protein GWN11_08735, partial [Candidatus Dadabacteria bacterium]|nr:hypothetical protein [Candidatus Dadabacteria bacterium]